MKQRWLFSSLIIVFAGFTVTNSYTQAVLRHTLSPLKTIKTAEASPAVSPSLTISSEGIGAVRLGMTIGQLKQVLGPNTEFRVQSPFMVDFNAIAVIQNQEVQYYILYPDGSNLTDADTIEFLLTDNPKYRTAQGIGPGTPLKEAESIHGKANLFYSNDDEMREYVSFASLRDQNIIFRSSRLSPTPSRQFSGIYASPPASSPRQETSQYRKDASIGMVSVMR